MPTILKPTTGDVPFVSLTKAAGSNKKLELNLIKRSSLTEEGNYNDVIGISQVELSLGDFVGFTVSTTIVIPYGMWKNPSNAEMLENLIELNSKWKMKFGWRTQKNGYIISDEFKLSLFRVGTTFNSEIRGITIPLTFYATFDDLLHNVPISLLSATREFINSTATADNVQNELTINNILEKVFLDLHSIVSSNKLYSDLYELSDVPTMREFRYCFTDTADESSSVVFNNIVNRKLPNANIAMKILDEDDATTFYWISSILSDNGLVIIPALWKAKLKYMILLQPGNSDKLEEIVVDSNGKPDTNRQFGVTWSPSFSPFDRDGNIISIEFESESSNITKEYVQSLAEIAKIEESNVGADDTIDKSTIDTSVGLLKLWERLSRSANVEIYGNVHLFIWDSIVIDVKNKLYDGVYRVMNLSHTLTTDMFTTSFECVRVANTKRDIKNIKAEEF